MTEPKKFKKGKHTYTHWGPNFKEVRLEKPSKNVEPQESPSIAIDIDAVTALSVYSNFSIVHRSSEEVILDFLFLPHGRTRARVRSRVILSYRHVKKLAQLLNQTLNEIKR